MNEQKSIVYQRRQNVCVIMPEKHWIMVNVKSALDCVPFITWKLQLPAKNVLVIIFAECKIENCEACFSRNFCTKCKEKLYLHRGKCYDSCPEGFAATNGTMECNHAGKCCTGGFYFHWHLLLNIGSGRQISGTRFGIHRRSRILEWNENRCRMVTLKLGWMIVWTMLGVTQECPVPKVDVRSCPKQPPHLNWFKDDEEEILRDSLYRHLDGKGLIRDRQRGFVCGR